MFLFNLLGWNNCYSKRNSIIYSWSFAPRQNNIYRKGTGKNIKWFNSSIRGKLFHDNINNYNGIITTFILNIVIINFEITFFYIYIYFY